MSLEEGSEVTMLTKMNNRSADEGDVLELLEPLPNYGFQKGQRGVVVSQFEQPSEAYDIAMEDENGEFLGFAYSVRPDQFCNVSESLLHAGLEALVEMDLPTAAAKLRAAADHSPRTRGVVLNSVLSGMPEVSPGLIKLLRFICYVYPEYDIARENLAIALLNFAVRKAKNGEFPLAQMLLMDALGLVTSDETVRSLQETLARVLTEASQSALNSHKYEESLNCLKLACAVFPNAVTRNNLHLGHVFYARYCMDIQDFEDATRHFEAAQEYGELDPDILNDYAIALLMIGRVSEATYALEQALEAHPNETILSSNLDRIKNAQTVLRKQERVIQAFHIESPIQIEIQLDPSTVELYQIPPSAITGATPIGV